MIHPLNTFVAVSNITCMHPLMTSYRARDYITFLCLLFVSSASFVSHLFENHKHGMVGHPDVSQYASWVMNRFDVAGCVITTIRLLYLGINMYGGVIYGLKNIQYLGLALVIKIISEYDKTAASQSIYVMYHSIWHMLIFIVIDMYLRDIYGFEELYGD